MKLWQKIITGILIVLVVAVAGFVVWGETPARAIPEAISALDSDSIVQVQTGNWLIFKPVDKEVTTGFIFYPGGRVDHRAYAPMARALAEEGYLVVIPKMPLNLAVFGFNKAGDVLYAYPLIKHWVIGGHSLGGAMAASYLAMYPDEFDGLVFLAAYPASDTDLTQYQGEVLSLSASLDGLATPDKIDASRALLPASAQFVEIEGGNHAYFGWYGDQAGDNPATISRVEQQAITVAEIKELLSRVDVIEGK
jgi:pimeloyl-ACP methyl ester carboxylesterase